MGNAQSTLMFEKERNGLRKFKIYQYFRSILPHRKQRPTESRQPLVQFLNNFPRAPEDWSYVQKVLYVENETASEAARPRNKESTGLRWIVHLCILQSKDPDHKRAKWTFVKLDTQAEHSVMFASEASHLGLEVFDNTAAQYHYYGINEHPVECIGWVNISFMVEGCNKTFHAQVDVLKDSNIQGRVRRPPFSILLGQEVINKYEWVTPSQDLQRALHYTYRKKIEVHKCC